MMRIPYNVKLAFGEVLNRLFLGVAVMVLLLSGDLSVLFAAVAVEAAYMLFVPESRWYAGILQERATRMRQLQRAQMKKQVLPRLLPVDRNRFLRLEMLRNQIPMAAGGTPQEMAGIYAQMDVLLDKFLEFAGKNAQYRNYLVEMVRPAPGPSQTGAPWLDKLFDMAATVLNEKQDVVQIPIGGTPGRVTDIGGVVAEVRKGMDARIEQLDAAVQAQANDTNKMVMTKNLEVLKKRRENLGQIGDIITNLECQLDLIESTFGLIGDQVRTQAPEQVLHDINDVVIQTETTTKLLADTAPMEQALNRLDRSLA